jgi:hypothetical protein
MHGGAGALISIGLLRSVSFQQMHACVEGAYSSGGDAFITECLWEVSCRTSGIFFSLACHCLWEAMLLVDRQRKWVFEVDFDCALSRGNSEGTRDFLDFKNLAEA